MGFVVFLILCCKLFSCSFSSSSTFDPYTLKVAVYILLQYGSTYLYTGAGDHVDSSDVSGGSESETEAEAEAEAEAEKMMSNPYMNTITNTRNYIYMNNWNGQEQ